MKLSTNGASLAVILVAVFGLLGVEVELESLNQVIGAVVTVAAFVRLVYNQVHRPDSKWFIFKE